MLPHHLHVHRIHRAGTHPEIAGRRLADAQGSHWVQALHAFASTTLHRSKLLTVHGCSLSWPGWGMMHTARPCRRACVCSHFAGAGHAHSCAGGCLRRPQGQAWPCERKITCVHLTSCRGRSELLLPRMSAGLHQPARMHAVLVCLDPVQRWHDLCTVGPPSSTLTEVDMLTRSSSYLALETDAASCGATDRNMACT
jgi:hypothetical protein